MDHSGQGRRHLGASLLALWMLLPLAARAEMMQYAAIGEPKAVRVYLDEFARHADADELILAHGAPTIVARLRSVDLVADAYGHA